MKEILFLFFLFLGYNLTYSQESQTLKPDDLNANQNKKLLIESENPAEFPGGMNAFRDIINKQINVFSFIDTVKNTIKSEVKFKVDREGKMQDITAVGNNIGFNNEIIRVIKSIKIKWKPAMYQNKSRVYSISFPMMFYFK